MRLFLAVLALAILVPLPAAQEPWEFGPCRIGRHNAAFPHPDSSSLSGLVYGSVWYPALFEGTETEPDRAAGPYPHLIFFHGHTTLSGSYSDLIRQVVSNGFVVSAVETNSGIRGEHAIHSAFADDQVLFVDHVERKAADPTSVLYGMVETESLGVFGHSLGASALFFYLPKEPRVRAVLTMQPYVGPLYGGVEGGFEGLLPYGGWLVMLSGSEDETASPWGHSVQYFHGAPEVEWLLWTIVEGMAHLGPLNVPPAPQQGSLPMTDQMRVHRLYTNVVFRAALCGEESLLARLSDGASAGVALEAREGGRDTEIRLGLATSQGGPPLIVPGAAEGLSVGGLLPSGVEFRMATIGLDAVGRIRVDRGALARVR